MAWIKLSSGSRHSIFERWLSGIGVEERSFVLDSVNREHAGGDGDIVTTGGFNDTETFRLEITVDWTNHGESYSDTVSTYLHKLNTP